MGAGETFVNFLGGSPLNRLSWLRPSHSFLNALAFSPSTRWVVFDAGQPLISAHNQSGLRNIAFLSTDDIRSCLGPQPFFGQGQGESDVAPAGVPALESARLRGPPIVFLGLQQTPEDAENALPLSETKDAQYSVGKIKGTAFFAVNVQRLDRRAVDELLKNSECVQGGELLLEFMEPRSAMIFLDDFAASLFATGRSLLDWSQSNKFCPACGSPTYSVWAGWKISCSSLLPWLANTDREPCRTAKGIHNFTHPRTDPVVIVAVIDSAGDKILLGRNKKFHQTFYSALAGFIEPGETFEDAVQREMWEEAGVKVWNIRYHSTQPWPFPANLMVGFYATADSSEPVRTDLDNELADARWYTREEVLLVLRHPAGTGLRTKDRQTPLAESHTQTPAEPPLFTMPGVKAIAGILVKDWAEGRITHLGTRVAKRGNL